jgi:hypothetical protein
MMVLLISPVVFPYHIIPMWILMSILGGGAIAHLWSCGGRSCGGQFSYRCIAPRTIRPTVARWTPKCSAISR